MMTVKEMEKYLKAMAEEELIDCWNRYLQEKFPCSDARIIYDLEPSTLDYLFSSPSKAVYAAFNGMFDETDLYMYLNEDDTLYSFNTIDESPIDYKELTSYLVETKKTREYIA